MQDSSFKKSQYEPACDDWICGRAAAGQGCKLGPDSAGRCRGTFECEPQRQGERWYCTRAEKCGAGPLPDGRCACPLPGCVPVHSTRAKRGLVVKWVVALGIGAIVYIMTGANYSRFISPGNLSLAHGTLNRNCEACHSVHKRGPLAWLQGALAPSSGGSRLCLECHSLNENALAAHNLPPSSLEASKRPRPTGGAAPPPMLALMDLALGSRGQDAAAMLPCALCHEEHRGQKLTLTMMDEQRCQSCHSVKFGSFAEGHPEFTDFPYARRTRLIFDHLSHFGKHFEKKELKQHALASCGQCHTPDGSGQQMLTSSFEEGCAACHQEDIEGEGRAGDKGVAVLTVPGLDIDTLRQQGIAIGEWPEDAEAELTPFMAFLLNGDQSIAPDLAALTQGDLLDLEEADTARLQAVGRLARAVKCLIFDLTQQGQPGLKERVEQSLGSDQPLDNSTFAEMASLLPAEIVTGAQNDWFPSLMTETEQYRAGKLPPLMVKGPEYTAPRSTATRPLTVGNSGQENILSGEDDKTSASRHGEATKQPPSKGAGAHSTDKILTNEGDQTALAKPQAVQEDILGADDGGIGTDQAGGQEPASASKASSKARPSAMVSSERWVMAGGWYRQGYSVLYRPSRHADPFLRSWLHLTSIDPGRHAKNIFDLLSNPKGPGMCAKCHSIDAGEHGMQVNWHIKQPEPKRRDLTRFSHTKHFSLTNQKGCMSCHQIDKNSDYLAPFKGFDPNVFASNFKPIKKAQCTGCHVQEAAGDGCLTCHNYHSIRVVSKMPDTKTHVQE